MRAGAAIVDITPPVGTPLDGYGGRTDVSLGIHDPLYARCLYLDDGETAVALVVCDLIGVGAFLVERARELIAERPGIPPEHVMISATHTHAGPAGVRGTGDPELVDVMARHIAGGVRMAFRNATDAHMKHGVTELGSIAQNRRDPDWPIDTRMDVVAIDTPDCENIATLVRYSCHATTLERDNLDITAEFPGAACQVIEDIIGGDTVAMYLQGACGNINPTWMQQDYDEVYRVGSIVGAKAAALSQELRPLGRGLLAHNIRWAELTPKAVESGVLVDRPRFKVASRLVEMPYREAVDDDLLVERMDAFEADMRTATNEDDRRAWAEKLTAVQSERLSSSRIRGRGTHRPVEIQAMRLGDGFYLLALPGEVFVETQEEIRQASWMERLLVVTYANDYPGYFCRPEAWEQGGYEAGVTPFTPEADRLLVKNALELLEEVR